MIVVWRLFFNQWSKIVTILVLISQMHPSYSFAGSGAAGNQCAGWYLKFRSPKELADIAVTIESYMKLLGIKELGDRSNNLDEVKDLYSKLSDKKKKKILKLISKTYLDVKTFKYDSSLSVKKLKRHFDVILSESGGAFDFFQSTIVKHLYSVERALQLFFNLEAKRSGLKIPMDVENLLYVAYKIQDTFKDDPEYSNEKVYLYGSFVNGRGISELSDLDFAVSNAFLASKLESLNLDFPELDQFRLTEAQAHIAPKNKIHQYGYLNPIVIVIHQRAVEVRVYKSKKLHDLQRDPYFLSFFL